MSPDASAFRLVPLAQLPATGREHTQDRSAGYAAGYAAGWSAGSRAAAAEAEALRSALASEHAAAEEARAVEVARSVAALVAAARGADARSLPVVDGLRGALVAAAVELAQAVLGRELAGGGSAATALARALAAPADLGAQTVRVSAADHREITALVAAGSVELPAGMTVVADPRLGPGDAVSEHPTGYLDAQLATALDRARRALAEED
jgi:flagellar assembly protein FliH